TARPKGLRFKYHAKVGEIDYNKYNGPLAKGEQDMMSIYFTIMDWSKRKAVTSGMGTPSGMWSADAQSDLDGCGAIIGYGIMYISESTVGDSMVEGYIPAEFYDTVVAAPVGNYTLTIACSTSAYGDYMDACSTNVLYVDDFEWVY
ncbi:MAG: PCMD domain-containing protein, partial [Alistipes sp.]|nr:PCMD domain-containing protein [Alistipes sp.]